MALEQKIGRLTNLAAVERIGELPVKVLQIGEGNFLRGFFDWMIHEANKQGLFMGSIAVTNPRPSGREKLDTLKEQSGLYTLLTRGVMNGEIIEDKEVISVYSKIIDPYREWDQFLKMAEEPELEFVISNTTEAGLTYVPCDYSEENPLESFPAKLALLLYKRYEKFEGDPGKGLIIMPCELVEQNGQVLRELVLKHCSDWSLPDSFISWILDHNLFLNSLVDRIVPGFPREEALNKFIEWGYEDKLLNVAEPYHLWVIQGDEKLNERLPLKKAGLNVHWVEDLAPFQTRKVRVLNGAHTLMAHLGILMGLEEVREAVLHDDFGPFIKEAIKEEIVPCLQLDRSETMEYAEGVLERFLNPFLHHKLADISLNGISKFRTRLIPTIEAYESEKQELPSRIIKALSGIIRFYKIEHKDGTFIGRSFNRKKYVVHDNLQVLGFFQNVWEKVQKQKLSIKGLVSEILSNQALWGRNLDEIPGLNEAVSSFLMEMEGEEIG